MPPTFSVGVSSPSASVKSWVGPATGGSSGVRMGCIDPFHRLVERGEQLGILVQGLEFEAAPLFGRPLGESIGVEGHQR